MAPANGEVAVVSIHAPTRGATGDSLTKLAHSVGFNPRPHAGGDSGWRTFNPRPHAGGDCQNAAHGCLFHVSIHAPTRGATYEYDTHDCPQTRFNPRPHAGGDRFELPRPFNSPCFNPRPHAGGDTIAVGCAARRRLFQSTPPRGGRPHPASCLRPIQKVSIHAPTRGATCARAESEPRHFSFNPRPHAGGDDPDAAIGAIENRFNPRPHAGGD